MRTVSGLYFEGLKLVLFDRAPVGGIGLLWKAKILLGVTPLPILIDGHLGWLIISLKGLALLIHVPKCLRSLPIVSCSILHGSFVLGLLTLWLPLIGLGSLKRILETRCQVSILPVMLFTDVAGLTS